MAARPLFAEGIAQVEQIAPPPGFGLICSEHEPLTCHRCLLVGPAALRPADAVQTPAPRDPAPKAPVPTS
jgi:hypothetical protein